MSDVKRAIDRSEGPDKAAAQSLAGSDGLNRNISLRVIRKASNVNSEATLRDFGVIGLEESSAFNHSFAEIPSQKPDANKRLDWSADALTRPGTLAKFKFGHGVSLRFHKSGDDDKTLDEVVTNAGTKAERHYKKDAADNKWYYHPQTPADIKAMNGHTRVPMQGELRVDSKTCEFTQVLRSDLDGKDGVYKETTRVRRADGTDVICRADGTRDEISPAKDDKPSVFRRFDSSGNKLVMEFTAEAKPANSGQVTWTSKDGTTVTNLKVEDNGNVTWQGMKDGKQTRFIATTFGEHLEEQAGAPTYAFNHRGDVCGYRHGNQYLALALRGETRIVDGVNVYRIQDGRYTLTSQCLRDPEKTNGWKVTKNIGGRWAPGSFEGDIAIQNGDYVQTINDPKNGLLGQIYRHQDGSIKTGAIEKKALDIRVLGEELNGGLEVPLESKLTALKPPAPRPEVPRPEVPRPEVPRPEVPRPEVPRQVDDRIPSLSSGINLQSLLNGDMGALAQAA